MLRPYRLSHGRALGEGPSRFGSSCNCRPRAAFFRADYIRGAILVASKRGSWRDCSAADFLRTFAPLCHRPGVTRASRLVQRLLPIALLTGAMVSVPILVWSESGLPRLRKLQQERVEAKERSSRLSSEIRQLRAEVSRVKRDPSHVERTARDELGLVRQTEIVFQFQE